MPARKTGASALAPEDRALLFTVPDCGACDVVLGRLLTRQEAFAGINIYLGGMIAGDDAAVRDGAAAHAIAPEWVRARRVTLNHDAG